MSGQLNPVCCGGAMLEVCWDLEALLVVLAGVSMPTRT